MILDYIKCPKLRLASEQLPLSDINSYLAYLEARRYSTKTVQSYISCVIHFFSWYRKVYNDSDTEVDERNLALFLLYLDTCDCPSSFQRGRSSCRASLRLWGRLITRYSEPLALSPEEELFQQYDSWLASVVGLVKTSRIARCRYGRELLSWLDSACGKGIAGLTQQDVAAYVFQPASGLAPGSVTAMVSALGCFVTYLSSTGLCSVSLPIYIPRPKPVYAIPSYQILTTEELDLVLRSFDLTTAAGKRDYCMARCLVDLGLRTDDAAAISLDNIDWRHRVLTLAKGKNHRQHRLPISDLLFDAIVDYV